MSGDPNQLPDASGHQPRAERPTQKSNQRSSSSSSSGGGSRGSGGSGGGGADGLPPGSQQPATLAMGMAAGLLLAYQLMPSQSGAQEITFSDFRRELLEAGNVERLVIVNKSQARVYTREAAGPPGARSAQVRSQAQYWFTVGAVGSIEKKLEEAQVTSLPN